VGNLTQKRRHPLDKIFKKKEQKDVEKNEISPKILQKEEFDVVEEVEVQSEEKAAKVQQTGGFYANLLFTSIVTHTGGVSQRKIWNRLKQMEDTNSERGGFTERPNFNSSMQCKVNKVEAQSNIDGYSDIWEKESQGYLENSKKLLSKCNLGLFAQKIQNKKLMRS
jgi:hypothetical protein